MPVHGGGVPEHFAFAIWDSWEVEGTPGEQAWEIMGEYKDWSEDLFLNHAYSQDRVILGFESFLLRPAKARGAGSSENMLDPLKVIYACEALAYRAGGAIRWADFEFQTPSERSYVTSARLKKWDLWTVGSEHRRDATRHLVCRLDKFIRDEEVKNARARVMRA